MLHHASPYFRPRKNFTKVKAVLEIPHLIEIQKKSYEKFLQSHIPHEQREDVGLQSVFRSVFPVQDYEGLASVQFVHYTLENPKYTVPECRSKGITYSAPVKVMVRLVIHDIHPETQVKTIRGFKEQEVYFGEIPLMTENATFIINGIERVVVSQLHRSPGVFFSHDRGKTLASGRFLYNARIIPYRGSWLDFEFDTKQILYCRIDRRRKMHATLLLKALNYSNEDLLDYFYEKEIIKFEDGAFSRKVDHERLRGQKASADIVDPKTGKILVKRNRKINLSVIKHLQTQKIDFLPLNKEELIGKVIAKDVIDHDTGEILLPINQDIDAAVLQFIVNKNIQEFQILFIDDINVDSSFRDTLNADKISTSEEALLEVYRRVRPGDPPSYENALSLFNNIFFSKDSYDLSKVGRLKLNERLDFTTDIEHRTLTKEDILGTVKMLLDVRSGKYKVDDIDHLGNRRVRAVGELIENQYRIGLTRVERAIKERLQTQELDNLMPHDLVNAKPVTAVIKEFFGTSQLSQFMDQTNPLSEIYHKRRLSALGPGGLSRERAGFEVRDVHSTHYGRICPIETPEGPNIGLIVSLASYARVNEYGFIETPFRDIKNREPQDSVRYYTSNDEWKNHTIAQANLNLDAEGKIPDKDFLNARNAGETNMFPAEEIDLMDIASNQPVSVAASLIPFLQNDDAHRALMGANMQRQGLPLVKNHAPIIGTGMEGRVAADSGVTVIAKRSGIVTRVDAERIVVRASEVSQGEEHDVGADVDIYNLVKFQRSNVDTCINQRPLVKIGTYVQKNDIIADGFSTDKGELSLGQNVLVAFMPWCGYNFEDAIIVSERLVKEDLYTSIHIQEFECISRDTKLGREEITSDIPNVNEEALNNLDDSGIVRVGAEIKPGDILVGKLTPKAETQLTPEEKLLRAIFGEKAADVRDTSLRVPPGVSGVVIGAKVFHREGAELDPRMIEIQESEVEKVHKDHADRNEIIRQSSIEKLQTLLVGETSAVTLTIKSHGTEKTISANEKITADIFDGISIEAIKKLEIVDAQKNSQLFKIKKSMEEKLQMVKVLCDEQITRLKRGDELPPGVIKMVKVYIAIKRRLQVGDKLAGRHGNKGVISRILPVEDMPYLENGEPVDIILSPLGVPSRMNIGQIMETHFGWAARGMGAKLQKMLEDACPRKELEDYILKIWDDAETQRFLKTCTDDDLKVFVQKYKDGVTIGNPVFDGATEKEIFGYLKLAGLSESGQTILRDGRTGEPFDRPVTVGVMYILKLHHLVDEKIHARSIGPYSLITQQPLGGKAQFGGQRLGEMEVWAMEAYGAAFSLQEFLTVKSDDIMGRTKMYEAIVKGENIMVPGIPESFSVLVKEMQSLGLDINLVKKDGREISLEEMTRVPSADQAVPHPQLT